MLSLPVGSRHSSLPLIYSHHPSSSSKVHKYSLDMTQELWALGFGCLFASFFQGYPPGGSFSRTALKHEVGVKTPFANIVTSFFVTVRRKGKDREREGRTYLLFVVGKNLPPKPTRA